MKMGLINKVLNEVETRINRIEESWSNIMMETGEL